MVKITGMQVFTVRPSFSSAFNDGFTDACKEAREKDISALKLPEGSSDADVFEKKCDTVSSYTAGLMGLEQDTPLNETFNVVNKEYLKGLAERFGLDPDTSTAGDIFEDENEKTIAYYSKLLGLDENSSLGDYLEIGSEEFEKNYANFLRRVMPEGNSKFIENLSEGDIFEIQNTALKFLIAEKLGITDLENASWGDCFEAATKQYEEGELSQEDLEAINKAFALNDKYAYPDRGDDINIYPSLRGRKLRHPSTLAKRN